MLPSIAYSTVCRTEKRYIWGKCKARKMLKSDSNREVYFKKRKKKLHRLLILNIALFATNGSSRNVRKLYNAQGDSKGKSMELWNIHELFSFLNNFSSRLLCRYQNSKMWQQIAYVHVWLGLFTEMFLLCSSFLTQGKAPDCGTLMRSFSKRRKKCSKWN